MAAPFDDVNVVRKTYFIDETERAEALGDDMGKVAQLGEGGRFHPTFLPSGFELARLLPTYDSFDASSLAVPVCIEPSENSAIRADANVAGQDAFIGFAKANINAIPVHYTTSGSGTFSITIPAGEDLYLAVFAYIAGTGGSPALPSAVSWNGVSLDVLQSQSGTNAKSAVFGKQIGTLLSDTTENIVPIGFSGSIKAIHVYVLSNVDQTTPVADSDKGLTNSGSSAVTPSLTQALPASRYLAGAATNAGALNALLIGGVPAEELVGVDRFKTGSLQLTADANVSATTDGGSNSIYVLGVCLNAANPINVTIQHSGVVGGFTDLIPGERYYVSNTIGEISATSGTTEILVGKALSATELLITHA